MEVTQLCPTLCDPMDCSPPDSSVHGVLQARILQWLAIPLSRGSAQPNDQSWVSHTAGKFFTVRATKNVFLAQLCLTPCNPVDCNPTRLLCPWDSPGKNTEVVCHFLLQEILPTQGLNPGLLHCRQILYP